MEVLKFGSELELCWRSPVGPLGRGQGSQEGVEEKTGFTWQKCSLRLRECGSNDRLGIRILPATLETMLGGGHNWEAVNFCTLGASERGSRAQSQSEGASSGRLTSTKSPGQMVVEVGGARRTITRRAAALVTAGAWDPYIPIRSLAFGWADGNVVGLHERRSCQDINVEVLNY